MEKYNTNASASNTRDPTESLDCRKEIGWSVRGQEVQSAFLFVGKVSGQKLQSKEGMSTVLRQEVTPRSVFHKCNGTPDDCAQNGVDILADLRIYEGFSSEEALYP